MQFEIFSAIANDMKNCINKFVNEFETKFALINICDQKNSKIYEKYKLTSKFSNEFILNMLQKKFIKKINNRKFI